MSKSPGCILMVTRNSYEYTRKAVISASLQQPKVETYVIDNASTDGTVSFLRSRSIVLSLRQKQESLASCWNYGLRHLWNVYPDWPILVCNNDVELHPRMFATLNHLMERDNLPFLSGVSIIDKKDLHMPEEDEVTFSCHPDFSCFMLRKEVMDKTGWFDEEYFPAYFEDNDFHVRMHRAGITAQSCSVPFLHHSSKTIGGANPVEKKIIAKGYDRNRERFYLRYGCYPGTPEYDVLFKGGSDA